MHLKMLIDGNVVSASMCETNFAFVVQFVLVTLQILYMAIELISINILSLGHPNRTLFLQSAIDVVWKLLYRFKHFLTFCYLPICQRVPLCCFLVLFQWHISSCCHTQHFIFPPTAYFIASFPAIIVALYFKVKQCNQNRHKNASVKKSYVHKHAHTHTHAYVCIAFLIIIAMRHNC